MQAKTLSAVEPRCEYRRNPLGIDTLSPRFGWQLQSPRRGTMQTAYQIQVFPTAEAEAPLWDSGKCASAESVCAPYSGPALAWQTPYWWRVRVWDQTGVASAWSALSTFETALEPGQAWGGAWVSPTPGNEGHSWADFALEVTIAVQSDAAGVVFRAADSGNCYMWQLNTKLGDGLLLRPHCCHNGTWQPLGQIPLDAVVPPADKAKPHRLRIVAQGNTITTFLDNKQVDRRQDGAFAVGTIGFRGAAGEAATFSDLRVTDLSGKVLLADPLDGKDEEGLFAEAQFQDGQLMQPSGVRLAGTALPSTCPRLRREIELPADVVRARAYVYGLGWYEFHLNGAKVSDEVLRPGNSHYSKLCFYDTYDVTDLLHKGSNALGLWLALGYGPDYSRWGWRWQEPKCAKLRLDVWLADGSQRQFFTDDSWRWTDGPIVSAGIYAGETYDARLEQPGWDKVGFDDTDWQPVQIVAGPSGKLVPAVAPPLRVIEHHQPVAITEPQPGVFVFDFGQNAAGWCRLRVDGPAGTTVQLHHSELLGKDGMIDPWTNRNAKAIDTYTLAGNGPEIYEPRFTYHGFRYVEMRGFPGTPTAENLTACVVHANVERTGRVSFGDSFLDRLQSNFVWSMRGNLVSIPTDCAARDERTPCQMDSAVVEDAAIRNFDMHGYYLQWLHNIAGGHGNPDWNGDAGMLLWRLYWNYGDARLLADGYDHLKSLVDFLDSKAPDHVWRDGFGDWCPPNDGTWQGYHNAVPVVNTVLFYELAQALSQAAGILGRDEDQTRYATLATQVRDGLLTQLATPDGSSFGDGRQTNDVMPLAADMLSGERRDRVFAHLVATILTKNDGHLDTGIYGTRHLFDVLIDGGRGDVAETILRQPTYPGFGFQIANDATTTWEQWTYRGGMNSHNHAMFSGAGASFYTHIAGIRPLAPGYARFLVKPAPLPGMNQFSCSLGTIRGPVQVDWSRPTGTLSVVIPANAVAEVHLPKRDATESGHPLTAADGLRVLRPEGDGVVVEAGSGKYVFAGL
jgi:alpha-L-rhamnosidase